MGFRQLGQLLFIFSFSLSFLPVGPNMEAGPTAITLLLFISPGPTSFYSSLFSFSLCALGPASDWVGFFNYNPCFI
jgi:hypothetical protein